MTNLTLYQVDAFTDRVFGGNPAAVVPLDAWLPDAVMQNIATENNLSETAFFVANGDDFDIRWFTPTDEIDLAGHPTLATAWVILNRLEPARSEVTFHTKLGDTLVVAREGERLAMDFPSRPPADTDRGGAIAEALGGSPETVLAARDGFAVYGSEAEVAALRPNMHLLAGIDHLGIIATAPGDDADFVSRFFAPAAGVPEDPVTGSAHCTLIPYWAERLGKTDLFARQISARVGTLWCRHRGDRVTIAGQCAPYMQGTVSLPD